MVYDLYWNDLKRTTKAVERLQLIKCEIPISAAVSFFEEQ